jgi:hypothetical protein
MKVSKKMILIILIVVIAVIFAIQAILYVVNKKSNGGASQSTSTSTSTLEQPASFPEQTINGVLFNGVNLSYNTTSGTTVIVLVTNTTSAPMYIKYVDFSLQDANGNEIGNSTLWIDKTLAVNESTASQSGFSSDVTSAKKIEYTNIVTK